MLDASDFITVVCPTCHLRLAAPKSAAGKRVKCPDCYVLVSIPAVDPNEVADQKAPPLTEDIDDYDVTAAAQTENVEINYTGAQSQIYRVAESAPPRWTFFSGVFNFPFHKDVIIRWALMSLGAMAMLAFAGGIYSLSYVAGGSGLGMIAGVSYAFFGIAMIWVTILTGSYSSACVLIIIEDTSAGNREVTRWPDPIWKEWFFQFLFLMYVSALCISAGSAVGKGAELLGQPFSIVCSITAFLLFPYLLLSCLETNQYLAPFSKPITMSLFKKTPTWIIYYALASVTLGVPTVVFLWFGARHPFLCAFVNGPVLTAAILIWARLTGRLAWKLST